MSLLWPKSPVTEVSGSQSFGDGGSWMDGIEPLGGERTDPERMLFQIVRLDCSTERRPGGIQHRLHVADFQRRWKCRSLKVGATLPCAKGGMCQALIGLPQQRNKVLRREPVKGGRRLSLC